MCFPLPCVSVYNFIKRYGRITDMSTIGFIGCGNMGSALAMAVYRSNQAEKIYLSNRTQEKAITLAEKTEGVVTDNLGVCEKADIIFLGIKPQMLSDVVKEIKEPLQKRKHRYVLVSLLAGKDIRTLEDNFGRVPIIRCAPNIPAQIGSGITLFSANQYISEAEKEYFKKLMLPSGYVEEVDEHTMECANGIMGCGPAFAAMFVEALSDGGVACGLRRDKALLYAAEMMKGTAEMLLETNMHPAQLKDSVCSPGGSTIQGVRKLEENNFRAALIDAVIATFEKKF